MSDDAPHAWTGTNQSKNSAVPGSAVAGFHRRSDAARQVADLIRSDIVAGRYQAALPYEWDLLREYGATRNVLRDALALIRDQGLISRTPGSGTFALAPNAFVTLNRTSRAITIYGEDTADNTMDSPRLSIKRLSAQVVPAPETVRRNLETTAKRAFFVENLIYFDAEPHRIRSSWVPEDAFPTLLEEQLKGNVPDVLAHALGVRLTAKRVLMTAASSDRWSAEILGIPDRSAILMSERLLCLPSGQPIEFGFTRYRADRVVIDSRVGPE